MIFCCSLFKQSHFILGWNDYKGLCCSVHVRLEQDTQQKKLCVCLLLCRRNITENPQWSTVMGASWCVAVSQQTLLRPASCVNQNVFKQNWISSAETWDSITAPGNKEFCSLCSNVWMCSFPLGLVCCFRPFTAHLQLLLLRIFPMKSKMVQLCPYFPCMVEICT